jgi:enterochelin esterase family protein
MKRTIAAGLFAIALPVMAQRGGGAPEDMKSIEVLPDHKVTFRIYAPKATDVRLNGDWVTHGRGKAGPMEKGANGVWSLTVGPLVPDIYGYSFNVDGVPTLDPRNVQMKTGVGSAQNILEVPGPEEDFEALKDVPHGEIHVTWYHSANLNEMRRLHIYTPPGYGAGSAKYPVLYLINGGGDEDSSWSSLGRAGFILDNLIAAKKAKSMIIVMPNGTTSVPGVTPAMTGRAMTPEANRVRLDSLAKLHEAFVQDLLTNVLPYTEKNYRVLATPDNRAVAGLSMGAGETLRTGVGHYPMFGYIGAFSQGAEPGLDAPFPQDFVTRNAAFFKDPAQTNKNIKLFYIGVGSNDQTVGKGPTHMAEGLTKLGIHNEYHETDGGHDWENWRQYLNEFAQKLFR